MLDSTIGDTLKDQLDQFLGKHPEAPSAALLVETPSFSWKGASGFSDPEAGIPMDPDDLIYIASVAKTMTATITLRLAEEGALCLDDTLLAHLPADLLKGLHHFEGRSYSEKITVRHLLGHTSGLADSFGSPGFMELIAQNPDRLWKPEDTIEFIKEHCAPRFVPGTGFSYSDVNYNLVGLVIESVTGASLDAAYRRFIYEPLGLQSTHRRFVEAPRSGGSSRTAHVFHGDVDFTTWRALTADWAGGGLDSTLEDLNRFLRALSHGEVLRQPSTREAMFQWRTWSGNASYGLGAISFDLDQDPDASRHSMGQIWGHIGASSCFMFFWPMADASFCGTFNQVACESAIVPFVVNLMRLIRSHEPAAMSEPPGRDGRPSARPSRDEAANGSL
ncbi:serine hydrolase domain-containing protein [Candidatus Bipolaricaulota bacterium]